MIKVSNLSKKYVGKSAVDQISFSVDQGEIVGFLGPNGAGKTTTIRMLTGYIPPTSGTAKIGGHDIFSESLLAKQKIGYMPENVPLYDDMRVREYLLFRAELKGLRGQEIKKNMNEALELCSIKTIKSQMISSLSKGFRQRVGLADAFFTFGRRTSWNQESTPFQSARIPKSASNNLLLILALSKIVGRPLPG